MENRKSAPVNEETLDRRVRRTRKLDLYERKTP